MKTLVQKSTFNYEHLETASNTVRAIAHPIRLAIIAYIHKNKRVNVNKIYNTLKLEQSITSQHLKILRLAKLVETKREGKFIIYNINYDKLANVSDRVNDFFTKKD